MHQRGSPNERAGMNDRELLAAAQFACDRQIWDRCTNTNERTITEPDFEQGFPMPFREAVVKRSREVNLDPAYVHGLIRQESRFVTEARSGPGASGLMQIMPATTRWTAKKLGLEGFTADQVKDLEPNLTMVTAHYNTRNDTLSDTTALTPRAIQ